MQVTQALPPLGYVPPKTLEEMFAQKGTSAGHSAVKGWLECPERSRLEALGMKRIPEFGTGGLDALQFGTLIHALLAVRVILKGAWGLLSDYIESLGLSGIDRLKTIECMKTYDLTFPFEDEPFEYLGIEVEVQTAVGGSIRTVRYDKIVRDHASRDIFSLEHKTSARSGEGVLDAYMTQFMVQAALWNTNPALVAKYGRMRGVIGDMVVKTAVPKAQRFPKYVSERQVALAIEWLKLPDQIPMPFNSEGGYARFLHSCWGRWSPCTFIDLCHYGSENLYEIKEGLEVHLPPLPKVTDG